MRFFLNAYRNMFVLAYNVMLNILLAYMYMYMYACRHQMQIWRNLTYKHPISA